MATPESLIKNAALKWNVDYAQLYETLKCESNNFEAPDVQSKHIRKDGTQEPSFGWGQFYQPSSLKTSDGRIVTKEIANDPIQAVDAVAYNFSIGNQSHWVCYTLKYKQ